MERIPVPYTATIGREDDLERLRDLLGRGESRVVSMIGPGGIGKSRLAIETARSCEDLFPDGIYFVLLEGVLEPGLLVPTIATRSASATTARPRSTSASRTRWRDAGSSSCSTTSSSSSTRHRCWCSCTPPLRSRSSS